MIHLYTWGTPNGQKASIMLEECGLPYSVDPVDISAGEQDTPEFRAINPNGKIPAIVDDLGDRRVTVFESGAVLLYLAEKSGKLLGTDPQTRMAALQWTFWQVGGIGPALGQWMHFRRAAPEQNSYAIERFRTENVRLLAVLETHLAKNRYVASEFSIGDVANFTWVRAAMRLLGEVEDGFANGYPATVEWLGRIGARPAVERGLRIPDVSRAIEPRRDCRRPFGLSYAAMGTSSSMA